MIDLSISELIYITIIDLIIKGELIKVLTNKMLVLIFITNEQKLNLVAHSYILTIQFFYARK